MNGTRAVKTASSKSSFLDKAARYLFDADATPDRCPDDIWLLGVRHSGWVTNTVDDQDHWPPQFYADFTTRVWCTYRRDFDPIRDGGSKGWTSDAGWGCMLRTGQSLLANALLTIHVGRDWRKPPAPRSPSFFLPSPTSSPKNTHRRKHSASSTPSPPPFSPTTTSNSTSSASQDDHTRSRTRHAAYVRLLTWFLDTPAPEAPFSVHRMALAGKDLGTEVGMWFGPSIAAGAIKTLVHAFPACGLGLSVATDGVLYQTSVFEASHTSLPDSDSGSLSWGDRPVLLLLGLRLGLDGVNPIYHETIKQLYTFPQSVGIAGGRPSSSYYFVGSQAEGLFYLDPHHSRPAVPLRLPAKTDDGAEQYYASAYTSAELQTFHCDKVRKMPISGLDPSMLVGFLCRDADEWADFRRRVVELPRAIFSVQEEPPSWPSMDLGGDEDDDALALESLASSEPDPPAAVAVAPPLSPSAPSALAPLNTSVAPRPAFDDVTSPTPSEFPPTPQRVSSDDSGRSGVVGKGRLSITMEGFRNRLRAFGRSRTSLALTEGDR
ncbi:hypothetical protein DFH07DRAFT_1062874 [Mycena maculata]|uniref:Cysteine protease n=1 Tax=Mycena maculata TaxID=230809 RepID=A0AAD7N5W1_9AGAR|nr:hypothetical protein DFH07DRAFT_1062874 [Mycena maculata]